MDGRLTLYAVLEVEDSNHSLTTIFRKFAFDSACVFLACYSLQSLLFGAEHFYFRRRAKYPAMGCGAELRHADLDQR